MLTFVFYNGNWITIQTARDTYSNEGHEKTLSKPMLMLLDLLVILVTCICIASGNNEKRTLTREFRDCYSNEKLPAKLLSEQCQRDNVSCLNVVKTVLVNNLHASFFQPTSTQKFTSPSKWITDQWIWCLET